MSRPHRLLLTSFASLIVAVLIVSIAGALAIHFSFELNGGEPPTGVGAIDAPKLIGILLMLIAAITAGVLTPLYSLLAYRSHAENIFLPGPRDSLPMQFLKVTALLNLAAMIVFVIDIVVVETEFYIFLSDLSKNLHLILAVQASVTLPILLITRLR